MTNRPSEHMGEALEAWINDWLPPEIDALALDGDSRSAKERLRDIFKREREAAYSAGKKERDAEDCVCDGEKMCSYHAECGYPRGWRGFKEINDIRKEAHEAGRKEALEAAVAAVEKMEIDPSFECHCMCCGNCEHPEETADFRDFKGNALKALQDLQKGV